MTYQEIAAAVRHLYKSDMAAEFGLADDIATARAVLAAAQAKPASVKHLEARQALEDMDDFARMSRSVEPIGAYKTLLDYIDSMEAAQAKPSEPSEQIGPEWQPCVKLPITVHVREQRQGEAHISTREGITPVRPDDLIMRGVQGEEYPIGRELFERTYRLGEAKSGPADTSKAAQDALAERRRQVEAEGWTPEHDDEHRNGSLAEAAGCYALWGRTYPEKGRCPGVWPWDAHYWNPKEPRANYVRAAALLLAEIERLDRAAPYPEGEAP